MNDPEAMRAAVAARAAERQIEVAQAPPVQLTESVIIRCEQENYLGDAKIFAHIHRGKIMYVKLTARWYLWTGHYWKYDIDGKKTLSLIDLVAQEYLRVAWILRDRIKDPRTSEDERKNLENNLSSLLARAKRVRGKDRKGILEYCHEGEASLAIEGTELDSDPWLLGTGNGVVDLRTLEHRPGRPSDYITITTAVEWQGFDADATPFMEFLSHMLEDNEDLVAFVLRFLGMALFAGQREHVFLVLFGEGGRNGKDTLMSILGDVLGDKMCGPIRPEMLMEQHFIRDATKPAPEIKELQGKRIVYASESGKRHKFDAEQVKRFTGGGRESARGLLENHMTTWERTHTLILLTNELPGAPADDESFWDRMHGIELKRRYVDSPDPNKPNEFPKDPDMRNKMRACLPGILACLVKAFGDYLVQGLHPPPEVTAFGKAYRKDEDLIGRFLDDCCMLHEGKEAGKTQAKRLYDCFYWWYVNNIAKRVLVTQTRFSRDMKKKGFESRKISNNHYMGVTITPETEAEWDASPVDEKSGRKGGNRDG